jgi:hypothetical protein
MLIFAKYQACDPILNGEIKMGEQVSFLDSIRFHELEFR